MLDEAIKEINPNENRLINLKYSKKFKAYNANVKADNHKILFNLSKEWESKDEILKKGIVQKLYAKITKNNFTSINTEVYEKFIENLPKYAKREIKLAPKELQSSFDRVNEKYFSYEMEQPNLKFGNAAFRKLGHYEYQSDTIVISKIFTKQTDLLDFVMYHELLHKKHGLKRSKSKKQYIHHSKAFRDDEKKYENKNIDQELKRFVARQKILKFLRIK